MLALVLVAVVAALFGATGASSTYFLALIVPITLGVSTSEAFYTALLPRFTRRTRPPRALLYSSLRIAAALVLAGTAVYVAILVAVSPDRLSVWLAFSPLIATTGLNGVYAAFLTAERRYALAILRVPLGTAIALVITALVLPFWESTTALAVAVSAGQLATLALLAVQAHGAPTGDTTERITARSLFSSSAAVFVSTLLGGQLVLVVERFLANGLVAGAVALLAYARGIALLPVMFAQAVGSGVFPAAAERFKALERDSLTRLAVNAMRLSMLAGLVSTAYVVICRRELVQIAFERRAFTAADTATTATLVGILAVALTGASLTASGARTLFALGRRREVLVVSAAALALYVVAAVVLRRVLRAERTGFGLPGRVHGGRSRPRGGPRPPARDQPGARGAGVGGRARRAGRGFHRRSTRRLGSVRRGTPGLCGSARNGDCSRARRPRCPRRRRPVRPRARVLARRAGAYFSRWKRMIEFRKNRTAKTTVSRVRFFSTMWVPPCEAGVNPMPPRPVSRPECMRMSTTSVKLTITWKMASIARVTGPG